MVNAGVEEDTPCISTFNAGVEDTPCISTSNAGVEEATPYISNSNALCLWNCWQYYKHKSYVIKCSAISPCVNYLVMILLHFMFMDFTMLALTVDFTFHYREEK